MKPAILAHRGNTAEAPENTLAAFEAVAATGADGVEFDVQASADGQPVVIHDEWVERTTDGKGAVGELSLAELKRLDAGSWRGPEFAGQRIPTLDEVVALLRPTALTLNIELKTSIVAYPGLAEKVVAAVRGAGLSERVILSSFNHHSLLEAARLAPEIPRAALLSDGWIEPWLYAEAHGFSGLHPEYRSCTTEMVRACAARGLAVRPYTVDGEQEFRRLAEMGVDAIVTNDPRRMVALRDGSE